MGAPKKKMFNQEVKAPTIGEKIRLLEIGKQAGLSLSFERLPELIETALEEARLLLLPMVQWFDRPLPLDNPPSRRFERMRVMRLYSEGVVSIWLERSGSWIVRFHGKEEGYFIVDSSILSGILLGNFGEFLPMRRVTEAMLEELPLLKDIVLYSSLALPNYRIYLYILLLHKKQWFYFHISSLKIKLKSILILKLISSY